jgi:hypothetical protein
LRNALQPMLDASMRRTERSAPMDTLRSADRPELRDGEDFVCPTCGCEITIKHAGDPAKMSNASTFTCACGTTMQAEHAEHAGQAHV